MGLVFGGRSGEHEVSIMSAKSIYMNLDKNKYEVIKIKIGKDGKWDWNLMRGIDVFFP